MRYLHYNLKRAKALRVSDAGRQSELYWTYSVYSPEKEGSKTLLRQGFSADPRIDTGDSFGVGDVRELNDPKFTVELPELHDGEERRVVVDIACWDSDHSTAEVKKLYTNAAMEKLWEVYEATERKKKRALETFMDWIDNSSDDFVAAAIAVAGTGGAALPYIALAKEAVPLIKAAVQLIRGNSDDWFGTERVELFYSRSGDDYRYRWLVNDGIESDYGGQRDPYYITHHWLSDDGKNSVVGKAFLQVITEL